MVSWTQMIGLGCALTLVVEGTSSRLYHSPEPWLQYRSKVVDTVELSWMEKPEASTLRYHPWYALMDSVDGLDLRIKRFVNDNGRIDSVKTVESSSFYGDVTSTYHYMDYQEVQGMSVPMTTIITTEPGHLCDTMRVVDVRVDSLVSIEHRAPGVTGIVLKHSDTRSVVLEFTDHLLVWGAPLTSNNGELLIRTIRDRVSPKPIRYAAYGHFHPHYTGGLRPLVADGATILAPTSSSTFIRTVIEAPRTLSPDRLARTGSPLSMRTYDSTLVLADAAMEARFYTIGTMSAHSIDFTLLYLPRLRMLIQDELAWIPLEGAPGEASPRQQGLIKAIDSLGLEVDTIIQCWPVAEYGRKTVMKVDELR